MGLPFSGISRLACAIACLLALSGAASADKAPPADTILTGGRIWTGDPAMPYAQAVAIAGDKIVAVGRSRDVLLRRGPATRVIDTKGRMVVPGFIDAHTHFENATQWYFEARIIDVDTPGQIAARVGERAAAVPGDYWITGVDWGALTARRSSSAGGQAFVAPEPVLADIDAVSGGHPVLLSRHDGAVFANSEALRRLRIVPAKPNPTGGSYGRDASGKLTGMLYGTAGASAWRAMPPGTLELQDMAGRALVKELNANGITGIHDIARIDALSQRTHYRTHVERSHSDMRIFEDLRASGDLSVRVYGILVLRNFAGLRKLGITPGSGDEWIRYGALKGFIDGSMTFDPWQNHPEYSGDFTMRVVDEATMRADVIAADAEGWDIAMHAYGDKAHWHMLNWFEAAAQANGPRDRRFRLVHAMWPAMAEIERAAKFGAVADITPAHMLTGRHEAETQLSPKLMPTVFAWRTLIDKGVRLNIVSDWPGSYDKTEVSPLAPLENMYYAVTRHQIGAPAASAWMPGQAITREEALRAYTVNPAWSSREENIKGTITAGKLADLVILSGDILRGPPEQLLSTRVDATIVGGRIVFQR